jgi:hypothetical protein
MIDLDACKARGVTVSNVPAASNEAVAEHAIALYFAVRRNVVQMHEMTMQGEEWPARGSLISFWGGLPSTCRQEVMGIFGGGELGMPSFPFIPLQYLSTLLRRIQFIHGLSNLRVQSSCSITQLSSCTVHSMRGKIT